MKLKTEQEWEEEGLFPLPGQQHLCRAPNGDKMFAEEQVAVKKRYEHMFEEEEKWDPMNPFPDDDLPF